MPRKTGQPLKKTPRTIIKEFMGEETASSAGEGQSFRSPSTDNGATRYSLDFTTVNTPRRKKTKPTQAQIATARKGSKNIIPEQTTSLHEETSSEEEEEIEVVERHGNNSSKGKKNKQPQIATAQKEPKNILAEKKRRSSRSQQHEDTTTDEDEIDGDRRTSRRTSSRIRNDTDNLNTTRRTSPRNHASPVAGPSGIPQKKLIPKKKNPQKKAHPIEKVFREIRSLQESTTLQIKKLAFSRLIREILIKYDPYQQVGWRITPEALAALQESAEVYLTILFQDANRCTLHRDRKTLHPKDIQLVRYLRGPHDPGNF